MPEPTTATVFASLKAIRVAVQAIQGKLENAGQLSQDDARYYSTYLEVAREAIGGLEQAYIEILVEAVHTDLANEQQQQRLLMLIDGYIGGEVLRPKLRDAIEHLEKGSEALRQHAEHLLIWPSARTNRSAALDEYNRLVRQLRTYLGNLGDYGKRSAVGLRDLDDMSKKLEKVRQPNGAFEDKANDFKDKVNDLLVHLDTSDVTDLSRECARVIETLRTAFRQQFSAMCRPRGLFTGVRGIGFLGSSHARSCITTPHPP